MAFIIIKHIHVNLKQLDLYFGIRIGVHTQECLQWGEMAIHNLVLGTSKEPVMEDAMTPTSCSPQRQFVLHTPQNNDNDMEVCPQQKQLYSHSTTHMYIYGFGHVLWVNTQSILSLE